MDLMGSNLQKLKALAARIYNATRHGENTAQRLGAAFGYAADAISDVIAVFRNAKSELTSLIQSVQDALTTETTDRQTADTTLQTNIDSEASTRRSADQTLKEKFESITDYTEDEIVTLAKEAGIVEDD